MDMLITKEQLKEFYEENEDNIQSLLSCPITCFIPLEPVVADDGNIYDDDAINTCYTTNNGKSPLTNQKITNNFQSISLWTGIINAFTDIDPDLKDLVIEKDYNYQNNRDMINGLLVKNDYNKLLKYKNFQLLDPINYNTFGSKLFSNCDDLMVIDYVLANCEEGEFFSDNNQNVIMWATKCSVPLVIKHLINRGHDMMKSVSPILKESPDTDELSFIPAFHILNNNKSNTDIELLNLLKDMLKDANQLIDGTPILQYAIKNYNLEIIRMLVDSGHDPMIKIDNDDNYNLARHAYYCRRDPDILMYLLTKIMISDKMEIEKPITEDGHNLIHILLHKSPTVGLIKSLIEIGVNLETENSINKWRTIHYICSVGKYDAVDYIMGIGVNLTAECYYQGSSIPPLALLDINGNINQEEKELLIEQFFQYIEIQKISSTID
jgi:hypothetical protein